MNGGDNEKKVIKFPKERERENREWKKLEKETIPDLVRRLGNYIKIANTGTKIGAEMLAIAKETEIIIKNLENAVGNYKVARYHAALSGADRTQALQRLEMLRDRVQDAKSFLEKAGSIK